MYVFQLYFLIFDPISSLKDSIQFIPNILHIVGSIQVKFDGRVTEFWWDLCYVEEYVKIDRKHGSAEQVQSRTFLYWLDTTKPGPLDKLLFPVSVFCSHCACSVYLYPTVSIWFLQWRCLRIRDWVSGMNGPGPGGQVWLVCGGWSQTPKS